MEISQDGRQSRRRTLPHSFHHDRSNGGSGSWKVQTASAHRIGCARNKRRYRVSYVRNTGEVYAVNQGPTTGPVFNLAVIPPGPVPDGDPRSLLHATL